MIMDSLEAHFWSLPFLCDLRIGVELAPKPAKSKLWPLMGA